MNNQEKLYLAKLAGGTPTKQPLINLMPGAGGGAMAGHLSGLLPKVDPGQSVHKMIAGGKSEGEAIKELLNHPKTLPKNPRKKLRRDLDKMQGMDLGTRAPNHKARM